MAQGVGGKIASGLQQPFASPSPLPSGMVQQGNIDVNHRPVIWNKDGTPSTIFSATIPVGQGKWALVPTIANGKFLTPSGDIPNENDRKAMSGLEDRAYDQYQKSGEHLGIFKSQKDADSFANKTHAFMPNGRNEQVYLPSYAGDSNMPLTKGLYQSAVTKNLEPPPPMTLPPMGGNISDLLKSLLNREGK